MVVAEMGAQRAAPLLGLRAPGTARWRWEWGRPQI